MAEHERDMDSEKVTVVKNLIHDFKSDGWEKAWKDSIVPWEAISESQPPLRSLLTGDEQPWPRNGRAFVAGCGRGYDPIFIATSLGLDTVAIDVSPTAVKAAHELLSKTPDLPAGKVTFLERDFFLFAVSENERFDLIYDYTFFVAIPPSRRPEWGRQMNSLIKPGGYLIALIFPLTATEDGPPFNVRPEHYDEVLGEGWETVIARTPQDSIPGHFGNEYLLVLKKT